MRTIFLCILHLYHKTLLGVLLAFQLTKKAMYTTLSENHVTTIIYVRINYCILSMLHLCLKAKLKDILTKNLRGTSVPAG